MIEIQRNAPIGHLTTFGIPATAAALVRWTDEADLPALLADQSLPRPLKALGGGSNLLFTRPYAGTLLLRVGPQRLSLSPDRVLTADAHIPLDALCAFTAAQGLRGLENLTGIPGTLGGALVQNAGAYGAEIADALISLRAFDLHEGHAVTLAAADLDYAYRSSALKDAQGRYVVLSARLRLLPADAPARLDHGNLRALFPADGRDPGALDVGRAVAAVRASKLPDPALTGSAGSFFRNPEVDAAQLLPEMPRYALPNGRFKVPAAWLIDHAGLRDAAEGGASLWPGQPLVMVNTHGHASAADVVALEQRIVQAVEERFSITLIPEVEHL